MGGIAIKTERRTGRRTCPLCLDALLLGLARCTLCSTGHHASCAVELSADGICATPGCRGRLQTPLTQCDHCHERLPSGGLVHPRCGGLIHVNCLASHVPTCIEAHPDPRGLQWRGRRGVPDLSTLAARFGPTCPGCDEVLRPGVVGLCRGCAPRPRSVPRRPWTSRLRACLTWRIL